jgi:L-ascorbate metabolism protein UlaG (beta-lactamase superfamily)
MSAPSITMIGGPTALIEVDGFRLLTDPTFDPPGEYRLPHATLTKTSAPALAAAAIGPVDAVLLSHDQHADNLDTSGRAFLARAPRVLTTVAGARRLGGGHAEGLGAWDETEFVRDGRALRITATPARHGPAGIEPLSGDVIGFVIEARDRDMRPIYVTGDTVWYDGVAEVARRFRAGVVLLFAGAAQTRGPFHLHQRRDRDRACLRGRDNRPGAPRGLGALHAGSQRSGDIVRGALGLTDRLRWLEPGVATTVDSER